MRSTLFDGLVYEDADIAKKMIMKGLRNPFLKIVADQNRHSFFKNITLKFLDGNDNVVSLANTPGFYAIFRDLDCLYVGQTNVSIYGRVYRFVKELMDLSRDDENHSGAVKARKMGITIHDNLQLKYLENYEIAKIYEDCNLNFFNRDTSHLDEHIAFQMKALCNTRKQEW